MDPTPTETGTAELLDALRRTGLPASPEGLVCVGWTKMRYAHVIDLYASGLRADVVDYAYETWDVMHAFSQGLLDGRWTVAEALWAFQALGGPGIGRQLRPWFHGWHEAPDEHSAIELFDAALSLRQHLRYRPPAPPVLDKASKEVFGWMAVESARRAAGRDAGTWFRLWRDEPGGRTAGMRYADWLHAWTGAGMHAAGAEALAGTPDWPDFAQIAGLAALRPDARPPS